MKRISILILIAVFSLPFLSFRKADGENKFVTCIVNGEYTKEQAYAIADEYKQKPGVVMCRLDVVSKKFFIIYNDQFTIEETATKTYFQSKGLEIGCYYQGIYGKDQVPNLTVEKCQNRK